MAQFMPYPGLIAMLCFAPAIIVLFIFGMLIGSTIWLLLMKRFVHQNTLATFFLGGPRIMILSNLCFTIFDWCYGQNRRIKKLRAYFRLLLDIETVLE